MSLSVEQSLENWNEKFDKFQKGIDENKSLPKQEFLKWYLENNKVVKEFITNYAGSYDTSSLEEGSEVYKKLLPRHIETMKKFHQIYFGEDLIK